MNKIQLPQNFNYIACFLTFSCQLRCSYCINHHGGDLVKGRRMSPKDWIDGLNRLESRDIPITLQGGEPTVYRGFNEVVNGVKRGTPLDLLTNLEVDIEGFVKNIPSWKFRRQAPYASIRVSYHHGQSDFETLCRKVERLMDEGYEIGVWEVGHPDYLKDVKERRDIAKAQGIDWRIKEFLGPWGGKDYGTMRYPNAVNDPQLRQCSCRTRELLIDPSGYIFRCHSDLYANRWPIAHLLDDRDWKETLGLWRACNVYGKCNSCDIKVKNNRFQEWGYSSVEIKDISEPVASNKPIEQVENTYGRA